MTEINLPLCGGAETLTLTLPEHYFNSNTSFPINSYLWGVPSSFTVVGGQPATVFGPNNWLSGRTITIQVPAGQFNELVAVKLWSRECEGPGLNAPATQTSNPQYVRIRRALPTITGIVASRTDLTCGDTRPITLTATTSQPGANSFAWTLPAGWSFAPGSATNAASVTVVPSGSGGGTASATATYNCVGYTTPASSTSITYSNQVATPVFTEYGDMCLGTSRTFAVAPVPGATSYTWTLPANFVGPTTVTTTEPRLLVTAPATGGCNFCFIKVSANASGCPAGVASQPINYGGMSVNIITPYGLPTEVCPNTEVVYEAVLSERPNVAPLPFPSYTWTVNGVVVAQGPTQARISVLSPPAGQWFSIRVDVTDGGCSRDSFAGSGLQSVARLSSGEYCVDFGLRAPATVYPNPADATLTLEQPAGTTLTIYNSRGRAVYEGRAEQQPTRLDTRTWPTGLYFLHSRQGSKAQRQQLDIKH